MAQREPNLNESDDEFSNNLQEFPDYKRSLLIIGFTGAGKSAFGNLLANDHVFEEKFGIISGKKTAEASIIDFNGENVLLIECPGLCDSTLPVEEFHEEICKIGTMVREGTDAVAIVIDPLERLTDNYRDVLKVLAFLGGALWEHAFLVFTKEARVIDECNVTHGEEYIEMISKGEKSSKILTDWLRATKGRYVCIESKMQTPANRENVGGKIINFIDDIRRETDNVKYSNSLMKLGAKFLKEAFKEKVDHGIEKQPTNKKRKREELSIQISDSEEMLSLQMKQGFGQLNFQMEQQIAKANLEMEQRLKKEFRSKMEELEGTILEGIHTNKRK